jgi:hypothetical protein
MCPLPMTSMPVLLIEYSTFMFLQNIRNSTKTIGRKNTNDKDKLKNISASTNKQNSTYPVYTF